ncbi:TIGR03749 family integrating conjugative element protein [uncultured Pseudoteredinibacter sp.]|uniref:TIGR03749 family integrating conjugative element protein n=1 Tax=uncultured Pseudoteredinibacter sp. TaxID=1641701 RepID=UPI0026383C19|nr:TIGR03749 family integrating conjugative element protein [uncultured Pseudoteredinibacter sp.]
MFKESYALALLFFLLFCSLDVAHAKAPDRVIWEQKPIPVHITVGEERILHFPGEIRFWLPDSLSASVRPLAAGNTLYLKALKPLDATRIRVQQLDSQQLFLLDIRASDLITDQDPIQIMIKDEREELNEIPKSQAPSNKIDWRVRLTQFAAQSLYAPTRLQPSDRSIRRVELPNDLQLCDKHLPDNLNVTSVASWKSGGLYVTAVVLENLSDQIIALEFEGANRGRQSNVDLRSLIPGKWVTVSAQHQDLDPKGSDASISAIYLVSKQSFLDSVAPSVLESTGEHHGR